MENIIPNKNGRIYTKEIFDKCLADFKKTILKQLIKSERKSKLEKLKNVQFRNN